MDADTLPTIIPIWLSHFDKIMPEPRSFPRFVPRLFGPRLSSPPVRPSITFGEPFQFSEDIRKRLEEYRRWRPAASTRTPLTGGGGASGSGLNLLGAESTLGVLKVEDKIPGGMMAAQLDEQAVLRLRIDITAELQRALAGLGSKVEQKDFKVSERD
ncbi:hypothetical protein DL93DRAFT_2073043 [Clavulina sp. PMI_390]|nr:hypothetical protein DL93DRAFT_2073043 [Clavulina sp. PMI_390]